MYRLVKATAAIATPSGLGVVSAISSGVKTWSVNLPATAQLPGDGLIPTAYGSTTIALGSYFWIQVSGPSSAISTETTAIGNSATLSQLSLATTGYVNIIASGLDPVVVQNAVFCVATNTAVCTAAGKSIAVQLSGLI
jgi:hypothetical protein